MAQVVKGITSHSSAFYHVRLRPKFVPSLVPLFIQSNHIHIISQPKNEKHSVLVQQFSSRLPHRKIRFVNQSLINTLEASAFNIKYRHCFINENSVLLSCNALFHGSRRQLDSHGNSLETNKGASVVDLVSVILETTQRLDVMAGSVPPSILEHLINGLHERGFEPESIKTLLAGKLWLLQQPDATLTLCQLFLDHGMSPRLICDVMHNIPYSHQKELHEMPERINQTLLFLRNFGFSEKEIYSILSKDTTSLFVDENSIRMAIERIKALFPAADTKKVVCTSPNVLSEAWSSIHAKFDYCIFTMGYVQSDIVKSHLFSHPLHHIQDRHVFLYRAGVFKVVNKKLDPSLNPNPRLKHVVDRSDSSFVKLVEGVSVQDYIAFRKMREIERDAEELSEEENEETEDEDEFEDRLGGDGREYKQDKASNQRNFSFIDNKNSQKGFKKRHKNFKKKVKKTF